MARLRIQGQCKGKGLELQG